MLRFFWSWEFIFTLAIYVILLHFVNLGDLDNFIQGTEPIGWAYVIWHLHRKHTLEKKLFNDEEDGE